MDEIAFRTLLIGLLIISFGVVVGMVGLLVKLLDLIGLFNMVRSALG
jgi:hypothetical protein